MKDLGLAHQCIISTEGPQQCHLGGMAVLKLSLKSKILFTNFGIETALILLWITILYTVIALSVDDKLKNNTKAQTVFINVIRIFLVSE